MPVLVRHNGSEAAAYAVREWRLHRHFKGDNPGRGARALATAWIRMRSYRQPLPRVADQHHSCGQDIKRPHAAREGTQGLKARQLQFALFPYRRLHDQLGTIIRAERSSSSRRA